jgi:thiamine kinase-like enzyme
MASDFKDAESLIRELPIWSGPVEIEPLQGGITNKNFLVKERGRRIVVRFGYDIPQHGVMRFNELAAATAAAAAGISPEIIYAAPPFLAMEFIDGRTYRREDVRSDLHRCVSLVKRVHREMPEYLRGPTLCFNVFHVIRDYAHTLADKGSREPGALRQFLEQARRLKNAVGPIDLVFGHNDLLSANLIDDGVRLWLVDWDYAGWSTPLFDLGGLSSNNDFDDHDNDTMLAHYFEAAVSDDLRRRFQAMQCASLLRESMWSMVSELTSTIDFDYVSYTEQNLQRFNASFARFEAMERS